MPGAGWKEYSGIDYPLNSLSSACQHGAIMHDWLHAKPLYRFRICYPGARLYSLIFSNRNLWNVSNISIFSRSLSTACSNFHLKKWRKKFEFHNRHKYGFHNDSLNMVILHFYNAIQRFYLTWYNKSVTKYWHWKFSESQK